ncbi:M42 family metallopeptidase [Aneurinibacillus sp. REN35]|uniref:M42 family metallopeptidase n=1 Tax=Aneurinibacillus sp. REN35 TaxID=3237286 RepID=UPI0035289265
MDAHKIIERFKTLVDVPSPAGYTDMIIPVLESYLEEIGITASRTRKGGLFFSIKGQEQKHPRMITAHIDTLGAMVKEVKSNGRLRIMKVGGFSWNVVEGEYCTILTRDGKKITGTLLPVYASAHLSEEYEKMPRTEELMEIRLDIPVHTAEDVRAHGIEVGDFVVFYHRMVASDSGFIKSRYLDNKINVAILLETLAEIKRSGTELPVTTYFYINTHEEIGYGGNSNISPEVNEYLALDIGIVGPGQRSSEYEVSFCAMDSSGPYDREFIRFFVELAERHRVPHKIDIFPYYKSNASAALASGHDLIRGLIGPGVDASHSLERTHTESVEHTARLLHLYLTTPSPVYLTQYGKLERK